MSILTTRIRGGIEAQPEMLYNYKMSHMKNSGRKLSEGPKLSSKANAEKHDFKNSKEVSAAAELGKAAYLEAVGMDESVETTGSVSEVLRESGEVQGDSSGSKAQSDDDATRDAQAIDTEALKARLLKNVPTEKVMRRQIEREIKKEIDYLHRKAMKMMRSPQEMNYFEMNNIVKKIRELRQLLKKLLRSSVEALKGLWLRYVHGIM